MSSAISVNENKGEKDPEVVNGEAKITVIADNPVVSKFYQKDKDKIDLFLKMFAENRVDDVIMNKSKNGVPKEKKGIFPIISSDMLRIIDSEDRNITSRKEFLVNKHFAFFQHKGNKKLLTNFSDSTEYIAPEWKFFIQVISSNRDLPFKKRDILEKSSDNRIILLKKEKYSCIGQDKNSFLVINDKSSFSAFLDTHLYCSNVLKDIQDIYCIYNIVEHSFSKNIKNQVLSITIL